MDGDDNPEPLHGTIVSQYDFAFQQRIREKERKQRERETKEALSKPAVATAIPTKSNDDQQFRIVSPFEFAMQQKAKEKERKDVERETKQALNTPQREGVSAHALPITNETGIMSPNDFVAQQRVLERERREKERLTREALARPATESVTSSSVLLSSSSSDVTKSLNPTVDHNSGGFVSSHDFVALQRAQEKARREKERSTREALARPSTLVVQTPTDVKLSEMKALQDEQRRKKEEARDLVRSYRNNNPTEGNMLTRMASDLKLRQEEERRKKKEAEELNQSFRIRTPIDCSPVAVTHKVNASGIFGDSSPNKDLVASQSRTSAELQALQEIRRRTKGEVRDDNSSSNILDVSNNNDKNDSPNNAFKARAAAELAELSGAGTKAAAAYHAGVKSDSTEGVRSRADAELAQLKEFKKSMKDVTQSFETAGRKNEWSESFRSKAEAELNALKEQASSARSLNVFTSGVTSDNTESLRSRTEAELTALKEQISSGGGGLNPMEAYAAGMKSESGADAFRLKTEAELAALKKIQLGNANDSKSAGLLDETLVVSQSEFENDPNGSSKTSDDADAEVRNPEGLRSRTEARLATLRESKATAASEPDASNSSSRLRTENELAALKEDGSARHPVAAYYSGLKTDSVNASRSSAEAELAALKQSSISITNLAMAYDSAINTDSSSDSFRTRTAAELASLQDSTKKVRPAHAYATAVANDGDHPLQSQSEANMPLLNNDEGFDAREKSDTNLFKSRAEAELVALKEQASNRNSFAAYKAGLKTKDHTDSFKTRAKAELDALKETGGSMKEVASAYDSQSDAGGVSRSGSSPSNDNTVSTRSLMETRLAALKEKKIEEAQEEAIGKGLKNKVTSSHNLNPQTAAELAALKQLSLGLSRNIAAVESNSSDDISNSRNDRFNSREAAELDALRASGTAIRLKSIAQGFDSGIPSPTSERFKSREAAELEMLRKGRSNNRLEVVMDDVENVESPHSERFQSREAAELAALRARGHSSLRNVLGDFKRNASSSAFKSERFKAQAASELQALHASPQAANRKIVAEQFNRGITTPTKGSDRFKSQAAAELAALAELQKRRKEEQDKEASPKVLEDELQKTGVSALTPEQLAEIHAEREAELLAMWEQRSSKQKLEEQQSLRTAELKALGIGQGINSEQE